MEQREILTVKIWWMRVRSCAASESNNAISVRLRSRCYRLPSLSLSNIKSFDDASEINLAR